MPLRNIMQHQAKNVWEKTEKKEYIYIPICKDLQAIWKNIVNHNHVHQQIILQKR